MAAESILDQMKAFGARLGLPKVDVDKLVDIQLKNIDALGRSAQAAGAGAKAVADKQRETIQAAFRETSAMVQAFHPTGDPQEILAKQKEYARRAFELAMQSTRDITELTAKTTTEATTIIQTGCAQASPSCKTASLAWGMTPPRLDASSAETCVRLRCRVASERKVSWRRGRGPAVFGGDVNDDDSLTTRKAR